MTVNDKQMDVKCPSEEFLRGIDIHELLPQQEPFVMVGNLICFNEIHTITETVVTASNIFVENGCFTASGLMENIAQTCASRIGYVNKYIYKKGVQLGFIGAVRNFNILRLPKVGEKIVTDVKVLEEVFGMTLAEATVSAGDELLASTEIKIAVKEQGV